MDGNILCGIAVLPADVRLQQQQQLWSTTDGPLTATAGRPSARCPHTAIGHDGVDTAPCGTPRCLLTQE